MQTKKAALYIRVSTDAQFEEGYSVDAQKELLQAFCKSKELAEQECYIDGGFSGSNLERPELRRLIADAKAGRISHVVVYKLDRLSRSQKDTLYLIEDVFLPHNVDFISINESFDTSTAFGRAMIGILSVFAQLERENIQMRTRMGMKERVKSGLWMGGGRVPFGYDYDRNRGILVPNQDAETVRRVYDLYLQGYSPDRIAKMVGLKYDRLAIQILTRKTNAGVICYNGCEYQGRHEPIIPMETYERAMDLMRDRSVQRIATSNYLLTGLIYCGRCGAKMRYQKWGKCGVKLVCYSQQSSKPYLVKDPNCDNGRPWADEVEDAVVRDLFRLSVRRETGQADAGREISALEMLRQQHDQCAGRVKRLYHLYAKQGDELLLAAIEENKQDLERIRQQILREQERQVLAEKAVRARRKIDGIRDAWDYMTIAERQELVRDCVEKVVVTAGNVEIHYKFLGLAPDREALSTPDGHSDDHWRNPALPA